MKYKVVVFGVKDTSEQIIRFLHWNVCQVDLIITVSPSVVAKNQISGYKGLSSLTEELGIPVFEVDNYGMTDETTKGFIEENEFELGISMGWQRLMPGYLLDRFMFGVYGFHGSSGYLPYGRGRSPLNWSLILGDQRFILNLFRYDENADSPNVFDNEMFEINEHDTIRTLQYKNLISSKRLLVKLLQAYIEGDIRVRMSSRDHDTWYKKRTAEDGKLDFHNKTRELYNLIRGVTKPFPGAFAWIGEEKIIVWEAAPFDDMLDFSTFAPGEVTDIFEQMLVVRTVDGSLLIKDYEFAGEIKPGMILQ